MMVPGENLGLDIHLFTGPIEKEDRFALDAGVAHDRCALVH